MRVRVATGRPFLVLLLAMVTLAWAALWAWGRSPYARYLAHHSLDGLRSGDAWVLATLFVAGWTTMVIAMMLPTSLPLVLLFDRLTRARSDRPRLLGLLAVGYVLVWTAFGAAVLATDAAVHAAVRVAAWAAEGAPFLGAGVLALAGAYQFTPLKRRCLTECRSPMTFILARWRGRDSRREAFRLGVDHGLYCVGCCWTIMVVMFAVGLGSLVWMLLLGSVMALEKNVAWGARLSAPLGVVLLAGAAALVVLHAPSA